MVRIPNLSLPSVAPQDPRQPAYAAPTARPMQNSAPAEIARLGQGLSVASDVAFEQAKRMDDERNLAVVKQHDNAIADVIRREYYDPQNGFLRTRGSKALGPRRQQAEDAVEAARKQIEESLENDDQRRVFADAVSRRLQSVRAASDDHLARETTAAAIGASEAAIEGAKLDAQLQFGSDPEGFAKSLATVKGEIQNLVELTGAEEKQAELFRRKTLSGLHENVLQGLIDKKTPLSLQQAAAYLTENGGEMLPGVAQKAKSILDSAANKTFVEMTAKELDALPFGERLAELDRRLTDEELTGEQFDDVMKAVIRRADREQAVRETERNNILTTARQKLDEDRLAAVDDGMPVRTLEETLTETQLAKVRELGLESALQEYSLNGRFFTTSQGFQQLQEYLAAPATLKAQPWEYFSARMMPVLNPTHFEDLRQAWSDANSVKRQSKVFSFPESTRENYVNKILGVRSEKPTREELARRDDVWHRIENAIIAGNPTDEVAARENADKIVEALAKQTLEAKAGGKVMNVTAIEARGYDFNQFVAVESAEVGKKVQQFKVALDELQVPTTLEMAKSKARALVELYKADGAADSQFNAAKLLRAIEMEDRITLAKVLAADKAEQSKKDFEAGQAASAGVSPSIARWERRRPAQRRSDMAALLPAPDVPAAIKSPMAPESAAFFEQAAKLYDAEWDTPEGFAQDVAAHWARHFQVPSTLAGRVANLAENAPREVQAELSRGLGKLSGRPAGALPAESDGWKRAVDLRQIERLFLHQYLDKSKVGYPYNDPAYGR